MKKSAFLGLALLGVLLILATVQGALGYGYYYGAGGYPPYDGHQYYSYGPSGWNYYTARTAYVPTIYLYPETYPYYASYGGGYGNYYPYASHAYYGAGNAYYYRGISMPYYYRYWPYTYRVYASVY